MFFQAAFCHCWKALESKKIWLNTKLPERNFKKSILIHRRAGKKSRRQAEVIFLFLQLPLDFIVMMIGLRLVAALRNGFHRLPFPSTEISNGMINCVSSAHLSDKCHVQLNHFRWLHFDIKSIASRLGLVIIWIQQVYDRFRSAAAEWSYVKITRIQLNHLIAII